MSLTLAAPSAFAYRIFVSNEKENTITVIDSEKLEVIHTIQVGNRPRGIILANEGKWIIVCTSDDNRMQVYDTKTFQWVKDLPSGPDPELPILHASGNPLYVSNEDDNLVTVVDIMTGKLVTDIPVGVEPEGMGMSPDGKVLVNTSETTNMAHFITTDGFKNFDNILVDNRPRVAEFKADGSEVWVSAEIGGTVTIIDPADRKIKGKINFEIQGITKDAIQPVGVRFTKDGKKAFVALGPANRVAVVNGETFKVEKYILVGQRVWNLGMTPDEKLLFTTNGTSNDVTVIDVPSERAVKSIKTGRYPWGVVSSSD
ncbi:MAG: PQQ-dependent catabolism-associated beta-propeller protein [Hyphomicrobium sp.]|nr:PQQ-dependent catabolism-associated beta-propeller protein [Hyphomicrobium sp.]